MPLTRVPSGLLDTSNVAINAFLAGTMANGLYTLCLYTPFSGNVISTIASANVGNCTIQFSVNNKVLPNNLTINANSTTFIANQSSNIAFTVGQNIAMTASNVTTNCANVAVTIYCNRSGA
jgi:hypothetical protein